MENKVKDLFGKVETVDNFKLVKINGEKIIAQMKEKELPKNSEIYEVVLSENRNVYIRTGSDEYFFYDANWIYKKLKEDENYADCKVYASFKGKGVELKDGMTYKDCLEALENNNYINIDGIIEDQRHWFGSNNKDEEIEK